MDKREKLIQSIMAEYEADGEPITRQEAEEVANMELGAKNIKRYEQTAEPKPKKERPPRKADLDKRTIIESIAKQLTRCVTKDVEPLDIEIKNPEREITFTFNNENYSITLTKHRKAKEKKHEQNSIL